jgi:hypothetical protein
MVVMVTLCGTKIRFPQLFVHLILVGDALVGSVEEGPLLLWSGGSSCDFRVLQVVYSFRFIGFFSDWRGSVSFGFIAVLMRSGTVSMDLSG